VPASRCTAHARSRAHVSTIGRKLLQSLLCASSCALGLPASTGCLVTDKVEYGAPNVRAEVLIVTPVGPLARVPPLNECEQTSPGSTKKFMKFVVNISDPNIEDELTARLVVNYASIDSGGGRDVPPNGKEERKPIELCIDHELLKEGCNYVEVLVSRRFSEDRPYGVALPGDLGQDHILVGGSSGEQPQAPMSDCYIDGGVQ
jgi:hypothetical protein